MKSIILKFGAIVSLVVCCPAILQAQGSIEVAVQNVTFTSTGATTGKLVFTIYGRQASNYSSGGTGGLSSANLRYDLQVVTNPTGGTFTLDNTSDTLSGINSTILTGGVTNNSVVTTYAPQGTSPAGTNASVGFTMTRNNSTDPDLPSSISSSVALFTISYPYTITSGSTVNSASSTFALRTLTGTKGSSWSSFSASSNSFAAGGTIPLPIGLTAFDAKATDDYRAKLNWQTTLEQNIGRYDVERSIDGGVHFADVVATTEVSGDSRQPMNYQRYDAHPQIGDNFYRLRIIGKDGLSSYSETRKVNFKRQPGNISVYPTANHDGIVHVSLPAGMETAQFQITNSSGQIVPVSYDGIGLTRTFNLGGLASGVYLLQVVSKGTKSQSFKISYQP